MAKGTSDYRITDRRSPATKDPYKRLAAAILAQAAKEARAGDQDAASWLLSEQAEILAGGVGLSFVHVRRWARDRTHI
ncbi:MAG: hypothetical protein HON27_08670 [Candidatus Marinimicrobia bacterium]|jgi:hypothetical protein|nr:hypothetical protein [Candidatus Neomarinimicrobiota bacterium]